ncbi:hypothetical protein LIER_29253 [Lithospermum erythrorhizon]|uniref:Uncharacterized protein n=1 Tax=Lithospermum erythrorhizon TaxID=34254 RepID=A0AAV3RK72_LITER
MKFSTRQGSGEIQGSQRKARGCYLATTKRIKFRVEAAGTSRGAEGLRDRKVCTLAVSGKNMGEKRLQEEVRSFMNKKKGSKRCPISGAEHGAILVRALKGPKGTLVRVQRDTPSQLKQQTLVGEKEQGCSCWTTSATGRGLQPMWPKEKNLPRGLR